IPTPALEMQYSPRLVETVTAEVEETFTIVPRIDGAASPGTPAAPAAVVADGAASPGTPAAPAAVVAEGSCCPIITFATRWVRKYGPRRLMPSTRSKLSGSASRMSARTE